MGMTDSLEKLLKAGQDNALVRFGLGQAYLKEGKPALAIDHLRAAVSHDDSYSAAWKLLGKALTEVGSTADAMDAYEQGIHVAEQKGDIQTAKEMRVFLKRLLRDEGTGD